MVQYLDEQGLHYMVDKLNAKVQLISGDYDPSELGAEEFAAVLGTNYEVGDVVFYNKALDRFEPYTTTEVSANLTKLNTSDYTPIGICVAPTSLDLYGDGSALIAAITDTTELLSPSTGGQFYNSTATTAFASPDLHAQIIPQTDFSNTGSQNAQYSVYVSNTHRWLNANPGLNYLASDALSNTLDEVSGNTAMGYGVSTLGSSTKRWACPITTAGEKNPNFFNTINMNNNSDFINKCINGLELTPYWLYGPTMENWKTADNLYTIFSSSTAHRFVNDILSMCCWRYRTPGTWYGNWYLPAIGELAFIIAYKGTIANICSTMNAMTATWTNKFKPLSSDSGDSYSSISCRQGTVTAGTYQYRPVIKADICQISSNASDNILTRPCMRIK